MFIVKLYVRGVDIMRVTRALNIIQMISHEIEQERDHQPSLLTAELIESGKEALKALLKGTVRISREQGSSLSHSIKVIRTNKNIIEAVGGKQLAEQLISAVSYNPRAGASNENRKSLL